MTFQQMHDLVDTMLDKAQTAYFEPAEKDVFLNLAQNELVKAKYKLFEVNEKRREDLLPLVRQHNFVNNVLNLDAVTDFFLILSVRGDFDICGQQQTVALKPRKFDEIYRTSDDPFNKVDDEHPGYVQYFNSALGFNSLEVRPATAVISNGEMMYLKRPAVIDGENTPGNSPDLPEHMHEEIVNVAVRKILLTIESQTYEGQVGEISVME